MKFKVWWACSTKGQEIYVWAATARDARVIVMCLIDDDYVEEVEHHRSARGSQYDSRTGKVVLTFKDGGKVHRLYKLEEV